MEKITRIRYRANEIGEMESTKDILTEKDVVQVAYDPVTWEFLIRSSKKGSVLACGRGTNKHDMMKRIKLELTLLGAKFHSEVRKHEEKGSKLEKGHLAVCEGDSDGELRN